MCLRNDLCLSCQPEKWEQPCICCRIICLLISTGYIRITFFYPKADSSYGRHIESLASDKVVNQVIWTDPLRFSQFFSLETDAQQLSSVRKNLTIGPYY